jgi:hypothetical protein
MSMVDGNSTGNLRSVQSAACQRPRLPRRLLGLRVRLGTGRRRRDVHCACGSRPLDNAARDGRFRQSASALALPGAHYRGEQALARPRAALTAAECAEAHGRTARALHGPLSRPCGPPRLIS